MRHSIQANRSDSGGDNLPSIYKAWVSGMAKEAARWTLKEGYILALAPAIGLFCINRYEAGRFSYLDIPSELIDLPVTRLISGGTAIAVLAVVVAYFLRWAGVFLRAKSGWREFVGTFLLFFALLGIPQLLQATTPNALIWAFLIPLCFAMGGPSGSSEPSKTPQMSDLTGFLLLSGIVAWLLYSFGFFAERVSRERMCVAGTANAFVAGFYGDRAIVKRVDPKTRRLLSGVDLVDLGSQFKVQSCLMDLPSRPSVMDRAFSRSK